MILTSWKWLKGAETERLRSALHERFGGSVHLFSSGREALLALLRALDLPHGSEVIIQGYTCAALPNAIHAAGCTTVYADINPATLNLTKDTVDCVITNRSRAVICQHTFGIPADVGSLRGLCDLRGLLLVEDCAHALPDGANDSIGKHGDVLMLSFGRDKAISGITGGAIVYRRTDGAAAKLRREEDCAISLSHAAIVRLLTYPIAYFLLRPLYNLGIGKAVLWLLGKLRILPAVLTDDEKSGNQSPVLQKLPNACAALALWELGRLPAINNHRRALARFYTEHLPPSRLAENACRCALQKFPIMRTDADEIRAALKKRGIHLEDGWSAAVVCPRSVDQIAENYRQGSCPNAEKVAREIVTLPTHPTMRRAQAERLIAHLKSAVV